MILSIFHFKKEGYIMCDTIMFKTKENIKKGINIMKFYIDQIEKESQNKYTFCINFGFTAFDGTKDFHVTPVESNADRIKISSSYSDMTLECWFLHSTKMSFSAKNIITIKAIVKKGSDEEKKLKEVFNIYSSASSIFNNLFIRENDEFDPFNPDNKEIEFGFNAVSEELFSESNFYRFLALRKSWSDIPMLSQIIMINIAILNGFLLSLLDSIGSVAIIPIDSPFE